MSEHLSEPLLHRYRQTDIAPDELLALDQHLETCDVCRQRLLEQQLSALPPSAPAAPLPSPAAPAFYAASVPAVVVNADHLTYEQMAAFVKGELSEEEHRQTQAHVRSCTECAWQVSELREFAATIKSSPKPHPPVSAWKKLLAFWRAEQVSEVGFQVSGSIPDTRHPTPDTLSFFRRPMFQGAVALAMLLVVAGILWQLLKPVPQEQVVRQFPSPVPTVTQEPKLGSTLATTPPLEQVTPTPRAETPSVFAMVLAPLRTRGSAERPNSFSLPANTTEVRLTLTDIVKADADGNLYQRYVAQLDQQGPKRRTNVIGGHSVGVTLPVGALRDGRHKLTLYGVTAQGSEEAIREYQFNIAVRQ